MYPLIQVFRGSVSRPWQLKRTTPTLFDRFKYAGKIEYHLVESVFVDELSEECLEYATSQEYITHVIKPQRGYGYAIKWFLDNMCTAPYMINWEDDYAAVTDIPLTECVELMETYPHINQICFNKRKTMSYKWARPGHGREDFKWQKEQREFPLTDGRMIPLVVKEKWWFGPAIWRVSFVKDKFVGFRERVHHRFNDEVLFPLFGPRRLPDGSPYVPTPTEVEEVIGCYIYGRHKDPPMSRHMQEGDSIWKKELLDKWRAEGRKVYL